MIETDWPPLMPDVARRLLGDPKKKTAREWRYGRKGSLVVHIEGEHPGTWHDFESDTGGGVLDLVRRERQCDQAGALDWLTGEGLLNGAAPRPLQNRHAAPATARRTPKPVNSDQAARRTFAGRLWAAAIPGDNHPPQLYLAGRLVWPPDGIGPGLPASVRWLPRGAVPIDQSVKWYDVPAHAAGAIVYAFRQPGGATIRAVSLDALDADGRRPDQASGVKGDRWRRTFGVNRGAAFEAAAGGGATVLCEGAVTALAARWLHPGCRVLATGGTSGLEAAARQVRGRLVLEVDGDAAGRAVVARIQAARPLGEVDVEFALAGHDAADVWTDTLGERAAIMEFDGGLSRTESEQRAWALVIERR